MQRRMFVPGLSNLGNLLGAGLMTPLLKASAADNAPGLLAAMQGLAEFRNRHRIGPGRVTVLTHESYIWDTRRKWYGAKKPKQLSRHAIRAHRVANEHRRAARKAGRK